MASAAKRPCLHPGCNQLLPMGTSYCDPHARVKYLATEKKRGTAHERGYTSAWRKARYHYLMAHPLCKAHGDKGLLVAANVVDHIIPHKGDSILFWDSKNWQSLCKECHDVKTASEDGAFGNDVSNWRVADLIMPAGLPQSRPLLTVVCGPAAGGKSSYIQAHASPDDVIIDMDNIRKSLGMGDSEWNQGTLWRCLMIRNDQLRSLETSTAKRAWFIVSAASALDRGWWLTATGAKEIVVVLASEQECIRRIVATRAGHRAQRSIQAAHKWWSEYTRRVGDRVIDTTKG